MRLVNRVQTCPSPASALLQMHGLGAWNGVLALAWGRLATGKAGALLVDTIPDFQVS